ncbi:MAG: M16 family metallopeptidase [Candidatus Kapaibacteriales bacterium]
MKYGLILLTLLFFIFLILGCKSEKTNMENDKHVLIQEPNDPTISFRIWFKVGSKDDPKGKEGLAHLTALLIAEGSTKRNSYENILDKLYPIASSYSAKVDKEMTVIYGRTHKNNLEVFLTLFKEAILEPAFKQEDFERIKSDVLNYLEKDLRYANDEELGKALLYEFVFENTPYRHPSEGLIDAVKNITLEDVKEFYKKYYTKENFVIGIGGGFESNLLPNLEKEFIEKLPTGYPNTNGEILPPKIEGYEILLIEKECPATAISFGFPIDVLRGDDDFFALWLFTSWFGEHRNSSSHLYQVIREKRGLNYGDYAYIEAFLNGGSLNFPEPNNPRKKQIFEVWLRPVQHEHSLFALRAALRELKKAVYNGLSKEDFETTKNFLYNYCLFYAPTTMARLGYQIDSRFYGINDNGNYIEYFRNKIKNLTLEQVNSAIKKHIQYNNIKFVMVTQNAEKLKNDLINNVPSPITYSTPKPKEILDEDKEIANFPLKVLPEKVKILNAEDVFLK